MTTTKKKLGLLMGTASMVALGTLALGTIAHAQDAAPAADDTVIVVTGQRAQLKSAQKIKKDSDVIVDSVTAVDIGALPDRSVADALQRISGVTIQRAAEANDPIRMTAEAGGVEIRGLAWVRSETNGRDIFSAKSGRGLSWGDVSSDLLAGVDVYKNPSADMVEGGIGGTVNLRTRLPFDSKKPIIAFTADATQGDLQKKNQYSLSGLYSNRWNTSIGEVGALFNYSLVNEGNMTNVIAVDRYNQIGDKLIPNTMGWRTIDWNQKRTAINAALQWRPSDTLEFTLAVLNAKAEPKNTEYNVGFYNDSGEFSSADSMATYQYDANGVFKSGTVKDAGITSNTRYGEDHNETTDLSLHARWNVNDRLTLAGDVQYVKSTAKVLSNTAFLQIGDKPDATIDLTGKLPTISVSGTDTANASDYWWAAAMDHIEKNDGKEIAARIDGDYQLDAGWLKSFKFGLRTTDKDYNTRQSGYNWGFLSSQYWGNAGNPQSAANLGSGTYELRDFSNFMNGDVPVPGSVIFPEASVVNRGTATTAQLLAMANTSGWGWKPLSDDWSTYAGSGGLNTQNEKTTAAYINAKFGGEISGHTVDGNFGVRVVKTESTGSSSISVVAPNGPTGGTCVANCADYNTALTFGNGVFAYAGNNEYTNTLPSLNVRLKWNDQLQFRFAASKGIVRPEMAWISPYSSLSTAINYTLVDNSDPLHPTFSVTPGSVVSTGTGGNPTLKPIEANQYDLTAEWYFAPTGSVTLDLFKKDLSNYIYNGTSTETYTNNGVSMAFDVARRFNGTVDGKVEGFEVAYQQFYDFLPAPFNGLGVQANYTHIDSSGGRNSGSTDASALNALPLEGMSPDSYNVALMYEKYGISARLAYNWRSKYLYTTSAANVNRPLWADDYGQLDGSVFYTLNANYKIGVQAVNLTHSTTTQLVSSDLTAPLETQWYSAIKTDRRISVVLRGLF